MKTPNCCPAWATAKEYGTDNEGYSSLLYADSVGWMIGSEALPYVAHCPWCGKLVPEPAPDDQEPQ